jgi:hypothetical protein
VSVDLKEPRGGIESARVALGEFHATQDEFNDFFGDVFDQLQALSLELFARHKFLEASAEQRSNSEETIKSFAEEFQRAITELQQLHGKFQADQQESQASWMEIRAGCQQFLEEHAELCLVREEFRELATEFSTIREDVQCQRKDMHELCANIESQISRLSTLTTDLVAAQSGPGQEAQIAEILEHTRQQQVEWLQQRTVLEGELETMRRRAAEQTEALSEQKRIAGLQQAELAGELKRLRSLMENLTGQVRAEQVPAGENSKATPSEDSMLKSVMAQFEMLQRDITFRRTQRHHASDQQ